MRNRVVLIATAVVLAACGSTSSSATPVSGTVSVFAAASLTAAFNALGTSFQGANSGVTMKFNFAGTPTLLTQIEQGAPADVFASADTANMDKLKGDGFTSGTPQVFARNKLEIVVAPGNPKGITGLADLAKPGVIYISEAATVPAGKYSLQALAKAGVTVTPKSLETDVKAAGSKVQGVPIPSAYNVVATYPLVAVKGTKNSTVANAFIAYVLSSAGQSTLESFGFLRA